jgi:hypothetical protein
MNYLQFVVFYPNPRDFRYLPEHAKMDRELLLFKSRRRWFMKTLMNNIYLVLAAALVWGLVGCSPKKDDKKQYNPYQYNQYQQYQYVGGQCVQISTNQPVNPQYCQNSYNQYNQYQQCYYQGNYCYYQHGGIDQTGQCCMYNNNNNNGWGQQCYGIYYWQPGGGTPINCYGYNCSGRTLYNQMGMQTYCQ